jgi:predicted MFS family arabinose efflux permease
MAATRPDPAVRSGGPDEATGIVAPDGVLRRSMLLVMATCCATSVANVYYAQPLLDAIASEFGIPGAAAGDVVTATQIGCALALLFLVPVGDLVDRKRLVLAELACLVVALGAVALSTTTTVMTMGMVGLGLLGTAVTQGVIAYAAAVSPDRVRGRVIGTMQAGVMVGVLGSRSLAGLVADLGGWRAIFWVSAALALSVMALVTVLIPSVRGGATGLSYPRLLATMMTLLRTERVLQVRGMLGLLVFGALGVFWSALAIGLREGPQMLSHSGVGAFGLLGVAGALSASGAGRLADRGLASQTTFVGLSLMIVSWAAIAFLDVSLLALAIGVILLDLGGQAVHVTNQTMIYKARPELQGRLVGCYMLFYAVGLGSGAFLATRAYSFAGWAGVCWTGLAFCVAGLAFWAATLGFVRSPDPNGPTDASGS